MNATDLAPHEARIRQVARLVAACRDTYGLAVLGVHDTRHAAEALRRRDAIWLDLKGTIGERDAAKRRFGWRVPIAW